MHTITVSFDQQNLSVYVTIALLYKLFLQFVLQVKVTEIVDVTDAESSIILSPDECENNIKLEFDDDEWLSQHVMQTDGQYHSDITELTIFFYCDGASVPITVAALSKARTVLTRWNSGIMGSKSTQGMDVCVRLFCVYVVSCVGSSLWTGWSPVQGILPALNRLKKMRKQPRSNKRIAEP
jgi:hypothetical protein